MNFFLIFEKAIHSKLNNHLHTHTLVSPEERYLITHSLFWNIPLSSSGCHIANIVIFKACMSKVTPTQCCLLFLLTWWSVRYLFSHWWPHAGHSTIAWKFVLCAASSHLGTGSSHFIHNASFLWQCTLCITKFIRGISRLLQTGKHKRLAQH